VLVAPGLNYNQHKLSTSANLAGVIKNTENRGDNVFVLELTRYSSSANDAIAEASNIDSSYAAAYYPWVQTLDPATRQYVFCPPSVMIPSVFAYNDSVAYPWFAPAGINRGGLSTVIRAASKLSQTTRDNLYQAKVNPLATFPGQGVVVYGQKTLQTKASALDRLNVRRLLIQLKRQIGQIANTLVFQQNDASTRNSFLAQVNPYLESVQQQQGLFAFKVVMDDSINNAAVIDRNELVGQIYLQPTKTAEFIYLNFNITPTGATFA
jgi:phage tail sheath protein FI